MGIDRRSDRPKYRVTVLPTGHSYEIIDTSRSMKIEPLFTEIGQPRIFNSSSSHSDKSYLHYPNSSSNTRSRRFRDASLCHIGPINASSIVIRSIAHPRRQCCFTLHWFSLRLPGLKIGRPTPTRRCVRLVGINVVILLSPLVSVRSGESGS